MCLCNACISPDLILHFKHIFFSFPPVTLHNLLYWSYNLLIYCPNINFCLSAIIVHVFHHCVCSEYSSQYLLLTSSAAGKFVVSCFFLVYIQNILCNISFPPYQQKGVIGFTKFYDYNQCIIPLSSRVSFNLNSCVYAYVFILIVYCVISISKAHTNWKEGLTQKR